MAEINFQTGRNYYHTLRESVISSDGAVVTGEATITGFTINKIEPGDVLDILKQKYSVVTVRRFDSNGVFANPDDAKNGCFECVCSFTKIK